MTLLDDFSRVSRRRPCSVCGRGDWCLVSQDDPTAPSSAICKRVESAHRWGDAGWFHRLRDSERRWGGTRKRVVSIAPRRDFTGLSRHLQAQVDPDRLHALALELGLPADSLRRLGVGLAVGDGLGAVGLRGATYAWSFPMMDHEGGVTGLRLRLPGRKRLSVKGSHQGLFMPVDMQAEPESLFIAEGETDAAALLALGFDVVGRPGCNSAGRLVVRFVRAHRPGRIVIVADADAPGRDGAERLVRALAIYAQDVRVIVPPQDDMRAWVQAGARASDVREAVESASRTFSSVTARRRTP